MTTHDHVFLSTKSVAEPGRCGVLETLILVTNYEGTLKALDKIQLQELLLELLSHIAVDMNAIASVTCDFLDVSNNLWIINRSSCV